MSSDSKEERSGTSLRALARLAWPITVSTLSYSVMTLVDTVLVGHLGPAALAGIALGIADGHARDFDFIESLSDGFELRRLDDGDHKFHRAGLVDKASCDKSIDGQL